MEKVYKYGTILLFLSIGYVSFCLNSRPVIYTLILFYLVYKFWEYASQKIVRTYLPFWSMLGISAIIFLSQHPKQPSNQYIVTGEVVEIDSNYIKVDYVPEYKWGNESKKCKQYRAKEYPDLTKGSSVILYYSGHYYYDIIESNPSEFLRDKFKSGVYSTGDISDLNNITENKMLTFANHLKHQYNDFLVILFFLLIAFVLCFFFDKLSVYYFYFGLLIQTFCCCLFDYWVDGKGLFMIAFLFLYSAIGFRIFRALSCDIRVKKEIKRKGAYITVGVIYKYGSLPFIRLDYFPGVRIIRNLFYDIFEHVCNRGDETKESTYIIVRCISNQKDCFYLDFTEKPELLSKYSKGMFVGSCENKDLNNLQEDVEISNKYNKFTN